MSEVLVIGRVVHYLSHGSPDGQYRQECRPAMVTGIVGPIDVTLAVFNPTGMFFNNSRHAELADQRGGTWHWPQEHPPLPHPDAAIARAD